MHYPYLRDLKIFNNISLFISLFILLLLLLLLVSCADDYDGGADLSQITNQDANYYCDARDDWGEFCDRYGHNKVIYNNNLSGLGLAIIWTAGPLERTHWRIEIRENLRCPLEVLRHEIGHVLGYPHYYNEWMHPITIC